MSICIMHWDQYITWFQWYRIFLINMATWGSCRRCQYCTRTELKHRSHSRLTSWHSDTMNWVRCKAVPMGDIKNLFLYVSKKTKHDRRYINLLKVDSKNNQSRMEEWFQIFLVATLGKSKSWPSVKLSKCCGSCYVLKVTNERCITTSLDVAKVQSPITLNQS